MSISPQYLFHSHEINSSTPPESYLLLASQYSIWKLSILGDGVHEKIDLAFGGKVIAIDFDYTNVSLHNVSF